MSDGPRIHVVDDPVEIDWLRAVAAETFGDMVKAVVDVVRGVMAVGADLHSDEETELLRTGSTQSDLWGVNLYPDDYPSESWIEYDSMINVRPGQSNRSRSVEDADVRERIRAIADGLVRPG